MCIVLIGINVILFPDGIQNIQTLQGPTHQDRAEYTTKNNLAFKYIKVSDN